MTVTVDINILLDVFQARHPHYGASSAVLHLVSTGLMKGVCAPHDLTTIYYMLRKSRGSVAALSAVDQLLGDFTVAGLDQHGWLSARRLAFNDFEDSGVAQVALEKSSTHIITRNITDFQSSPVSAISPSDFLTQFFPALPFS